MFNWSTTVVHASQSVRVTCESGWRLDRKWSEQLDDYDLWFVWSGRGSMRLRDREIELRPGVGIWARPGGLYLAEHNPKRPLGVTAVHFDLTDTRTGNRPADRELPPEVFEVLDIGYVDAVMSRIVELHQRANTPNCRRRDELRAAASTLLMGLLRDLTSGALEMDESISGKQRQRYRIINELASAIRTAPHSASSIPDMARRAGCGVDHFTRIFKQIIGDSPGRYVIKARISRARQLLRETDLTVSQIADLLGYQDIYFFSRQFKRYAGMSPKAYRNQSG